MQKLYVGLLCIFTSIIISSCYIQPARALDTSTVVISHVQTRDVTSSYDELVSIYNNTPETIDVTGWCLQYASAGKPTDPLPIPTTAWNELVCFKDAANPTQHFYLPGRSYALAVSTDLTKSIGYDLEFSPTLSNDHGHVRLVNANFSEIDRIGWGDAVYAEGYKPVKVPPTGQFLSRAMTSDVLYQDTNVNEADFQSNPIVSLAYHEIYFAKDMCLNIAGIQSLIPDNYTVDSSYNCIPIIDICVNINGLQISLSPGYLLDNDGTCQPDSCLNIIGLQISVPTGMDADINGGCYAHDECNNFPGIQSRLPDGFKHSISGDCVLGILPLEISEMLPNSIGTDEGKEFVEIYNPNEVSVDLAYYRLLVGPGLGTLYEFPPGSIIAPHGYITFYNNQIAFTLLNTSSQVGLGLIDGTIAYKADAYINPGDDKAWALVDNQWQYSDQSTPGSANLPSLVVQNVVEAATIMTNLAPCAANQYRNPDTNRCRLIAVSTVTIAPCADGQYRSEITNRCRSIALAGSTLTPCADNQYRSEETNRCRSVTAVLAASIKPCADNQYRSEETNRCRNIVQVVTAPFAVEPTQSNNGSYTGWLVGGGVAALALGYGIWEWRREIILGLKKVSSFILSRK